MKKLISLFIIGIFILTACGAEGDPGVAKLAQCLTDKGAKMYGAVWCSHCAAQKREFGSAWELINYIECDPGTDKEGAIECAEAGIEGFPTWEFADGERLVGRQTFEALAEKAGCELDLNN